MPCKTEHNGVPLQKDIAIEKAFYERVSQTHSSLPVLSMQHGLLLLPPSFIYPEPFLRYLEIMVIHLNADEVSSRIHAGNAVHKLNQLLFLLLTFNYNAVYCNWLRLLKPKPQADRYTLPAIFYFSFLTIFIREFSFVIIKTLS